ncbi:MAG: hypothetical protein PVH93_02430 [Nitrosopumilaceae archaeon]
MFFKGVIIVTGVALVAISSLVLFSYDFEENSQMTETNFQKILDIAKEFIISNPTFSYDGISDTLKLEISPLDDTNSKFLVEGEFNTQHTGYGNREKVDLPEKITFHTIEVVIVDERVISAVIDNQWDELNQIPCSTASC